VPARTSATLTEAELRLMEVLWAKGPSSVQQVVDALPPDTPLAYNSVLTTIRILERKGYVQHDKDGRAHIYKPVVARQEAARSEVRNLVRRMFRDSHELLVLNVLEEAQIDAAELNRLRALLKQKKEEE
jgi:BlaI family transcriptional regulator, penicillinase repressor